MRKTLFLFALLALLSPFALADEAPVAAEVESTAVTESEPSQDQEAVPTVTSLEELLAKTDPTHDAENKYLCMPGSCTTAWDCEMNQDPGMCNDYMCNNPSGTACAGTCSCC